MSVNRYGKRISKRLRRSAGMLLCALLVLQSGVGGVQLPGGYAAAQMPDDGCAAERTARQMVSGGAMLRPLPETGGLEIDTAHVYENMKTSYAQGYIPVVENDTVHLVVPFLAQEELRGDRLTAGISMSENAPFVYANFQKEVKKEICLFEERIEVYLFQCDIVLEKVRKNGKYPVIVQASGYTETGAPVQGAYQLYITIADGTGGDPPEPDTPGNEPGHDEPVTEPQTNEPVTEPQPNTPTTEPQPDGPDEPVTPVTPEEPDTEEPQTEPVTGDPSALPADGGYTGGGGYSGGSYSGGDYGGAAETEKIYHQPKLLLESNSLSGQRIQAGQEKEFVTVFANTSQSDSIYNLKVTLKPADNSLSLTTTSFYFSRVYPQETIALTTGAAAAAGAGSGQQAVTFSFEYENEKGTVYNATEDVFLEIYQPAQAVLEGFALPSKVYSQETVETAVRIRNTGKTAIYQARIELNAPGLFATEAVTAGNVEAGAVFDGSMRIYVGNKNMESISQYDAEAGESAYGQTAGTLTLTYEDADGEVYTQTQEFTTVIEKPQIVELTVEKETVQTNEWYGAVLMLLVLLFLLIIAILGLRLKRSRDRLADLLAAKKKEQSG